MQSHRPTRNYTEESPDSVIADKRICVILTGGTIGHVQRVRDGKAIVDAIKSREDFIGLIPEITEVLESTRSF